MRGSARNVALGGLLAAAAMVVMCLGGMIPAAAYACPVICCLLLQVVLRLCGRRIAWTWYGAVTLLTLLVGPDKEAAAVFAVLGYYPIIKPQLDRARMRVLWKLLLFNGAIAVLYVGLIYVMGLQSVAAEYSALGIFWLAVLVLMGNITFFLLDRLLGYRFKKR